MPRPSVRHLEALSHGTGRPRHRRQSRKSVSEISMLTAMTTPGHTPGALSWRWVSCDGGVCRTDRLRRQPDAVSSPNYRFSDHPAYVAAYHSSSRKLRRIRCDILLTPHPGAQPHAAPAGTRKTTLRYRRVPQYAAGLTKHSTTGWRRKPPRIELPITVPCTRAQGEAIADAVEIFPDADHPPVLVADEPDRREARRVVDPRLFRT